MRNKNQSVEDARLRKQDKEMARKFRAVKELNHEMAKQGDRYDRNVRHIIEYHGISVASLFRVYKFNEKRGTKSVEDITLETNGALTKQFKHISYIIKKVREYNEIVKNSELNHVMILKYDGDILEIVLRFWNDPFYQIDHETIETDKTFYKLDIMSLNYADASRELAKVPQKIKVLATKL